MRIKELIKSGVSLAPMAGITDYVLRSLIRKYSSSCLLTTEMISSEFLAQARESDITKLDDTHHPISYQISGHKPFLIKQAAERLSEFADIIDINMGCPVNKVVRGQDGCSLMRTPILAADLVKAVKDGTDTPVSVKFRLGYTVEEMNFIEFGQQMQEAGAEFITLHGRTRSQMYSGRADWKLIKKLKENIDVPVFANGDVVSIDSAIECLEQSGADGVAIGRGALGCPDLIHRIEHYIKTGEKLVERPIEDAVSDLMWHLNEEIQLRGENVGVKFMRKFYPYYLSGFKNAKILRSELVLEDDIDKINKILNNLL